MFALPNDEGTGLTDFELAVGRLPSSLNMRDMWKRADSDRIREYSIDATYIFKVMLLNLDVKADIGSRGLKGIKSRYMLRDGTFDLKRFKHDWNESVKLINTALKEFEKLYGVCGKKYLPFAPMVVTYAAIWRYVWETKNYNLNKEKRIRAKLGRWYWSSVVGQRYKAGTNAVIRKDYEVLKEWIDPRSVKTRRRFVNRDSVYDIERLLYRTRSPADAVYRAVVCLPLMSRGKDLYSGQPITASKLNDHHIYPVNKLRGKFAEEDINQVANRVITCERPNKRIQDSWPWNTPLKEATRVDLRTFYLPLNIVKEKVAFKEFLTYRRKELAKKLYQLVRNA